MERGRMCVCVCVCVLCTQTIPCMLCVRTQVCGWQGKGKVGGCVCVYWKAVQYVCACVGSESKRV